MRRLLRIGTPAGLEQAAFQLGFTTFIWIVALYGNAANAAYQIGVQILSFSFLVGFALLDRRLDARRPAPGRRRSGRTPSAAAGARCGWRSA